MKEILTNKKKLIAILIGAMTLTAIVICSAFYVYSFSKTAPREQVMFSQQEEPALTDFGTTTPSDFPADIPLEKGAKIEQSFSFNSETQKQSTIVFLSSKTVKENYAFYTDFFQKQGLTIPTTNTYESAGISAFYVTRDATDISITVSQVPTTTLSQVSISVLKK